MDQLDQLRSKRSVEKPGTSWCFTYVGPYRQGRRPTPGPVLQSSTRRWSDTIIRPSAAVVVLSGKSGKPWIDREREGRVLWFYQGGHELVLMRRMYVGDVVRIMRLYGRSLVMQQVMQCPTFAGRFVRVRAFNRRQKNRRCSLSMSGAFLETHFGAE